MDHSPETTGPSTETATQADPTRLEDARLVGRALDGDRDALGEIYDRYADRVHTMCLHMLRDHDEAADVCGEVFLVAFQRLAQLREPARLRSWLFAIARHEVYRRSARRGRTDLIEEVDEMDRIAMSGQGMAATVAGPGDLEDGADAEELVAVLRLAADGLDERDRMVMELQLQDLDGEDLAAALGTSTSTAYQQVHRMKERLERSIGAVMVARQGRQECDELDRVLKGWDGTFSVLWRKRVARHVDGCEVCDRRRRAVPAVLLGGAAAAVPLLGASPVSAAPASVRERVLRDARVAGDAGGSEPGWRRDGFPPHEGAGRRRALVAAIVAAALLLALVVGVLLWSLGDEEVELTTAGAASDTVATTTTSTTSTTLPAESTTVPATPVEGGEPPPVVAPPAAPDAPPAGEDLPIDVAPESPVPAPPVTAAPPPVPPEVRFSVVPAVVYHPTPGSTDCGVPDPFHVVAPTATSVVLRARWSGQEHLGSAARVGGEWISDLEVPTTMIGPLTVEAIAVDGAGVLGVSAAVSVPAANCLTPG